MFSKFGTIKSAKISTNPTTLKSKCYGYVWFTNEEACQTAILEARGYLQSKRVPYACKLFELSGLRHAKTFVQPEGFQTVTVINYPEDYTGEELRSIFPDAPILSCIMLPRKSLEKSASWPSIKTRAEITFRTHEHAQDACMLDGVTICGMRLQVKPSTQQIIKKSINQQAQALAAASSQTGSNGKAQNNLYISGLPKDIEGDASEVAFRRICARYGKIVSFKLTNDPKFATNLIYVAYKHPQQAALALANIKDEPEFTSHDLTVNWHKKKSVVQEETKEEDPFNNESIAAILDEFNLLNTPAKLIANNSVNSLKKSNNMQAAS